MKDHGLDLAVIGNGRTAALVDPCSRIVWWCYPRFDSDPIFCRCWRARRRKDSPTSCSTTWRSINPNMSATPRSSAPSSRSPGGEVRITDFVPRFRISAAMFRPPQMFRIDRADRRSAAHHHPRCGRPATTASRCRNVARQQPHPLFRRRHRHPPDHRRAAVADRRRSAFVLTRPVHWYSVPTSRSPAICSRPAANSSTAPAILDGMGAPAVDLLRLARGHHPRRHHAQAQQFRRDRGHRRRAYDVDSGSAGLRPHLGLPLLLATRRIFRRPGPQSHRRDAHDGGIHLVHDVDRLEAGPGAAAALQRRADE